MCVNAHLYAIGGYDGLNQLATVERYNVARNTWEARASMQCCRSTHGVAVYQGCVFVLGQFTHTYDEYSEPSRGSSPGLMTMTHHQQKSKGCETLFDVLSHVTQQASTPLQSLFFPRILVLVPNCAFAVIIQAASTSTTLCPAWSATAPRGTNGHT